MSDRIHVLCCFVYNFVIVYLLVLKQYSENKAQSGGKELSQILHLGNYFLSFDLQANGKAINGCVYVHGNGHTTRVV